ncbi:BTB/POZ domain protein, putative (DUF177) [Tasmannia lanceolata]|uniref:BTB/POZ domain protein, putative (DUF177) n=1 Tax=Tasmannia lanceolata TaxID=3420 RepID=UPI004062A695
MALISPFSSPFPALSTKFNLSSSEIRKKTISNPNFSLLYCKTPRKIPSFSSKIPSYKTLMPSNSRNLKRLTIFSSLRFLDEDVGSPWEGAIIYKRDPSISHIEYCTTLERLGLEKLSADVSRSRAAEMGLRVTRGVKDYPLGTPVQISVDITRKKKKLKLDGIVRTVITLGCNRCAEPTAECIFSNFTLLLTEEPIEEPDTISMGTIFGEDKFKKTYGSSEDEDDEDSIDLDDQLFFPAEEKEIDISKHIRDIVHLEITITSICDPSCKGVCLNCGTNLNRSSCNCSKQEVKGKGMVLSET